MTTDPCAPLSARAQALLEDLAPGRRAGWKAANPGGLAIGIMPVFAPRPLFEAIGVLPVDIFGGGDRVDIIKGDAYYQSRTSVTSRAAPWRSASASHLDALDGMVFPSTCDVIRNLSGMWRMLFPQKYSSYLDLPQNFEPPLGGKFYLHDCSASPPSSPSAGRARSPRTICGWPSTRTNAAPRWPTSTRCAPQRALAGARLRGVPADPRRRRAAPVSNTRPCCASSWRRRTPAPRGPTTTSGSSSSGAFCEQPPLGLIRTLERSGCDIVDDDFQLGLRTIEGHIPLECGPGDTIPLDARRDARSAYLERGQATAVALHRRRSRAARWSSRVRARRPRA